MAFHPYPQVILSVFNRSGFGPPRDLTPASACPWVDHPASRLHRATARPVQTRFRCGSLPSLTSQRGATRWLILQKARRHTLRRVLRLLVGARFQVLFHSPLGVLFTFPSRYSSTIGHRRVLSLGGWSPLIPTGFHVSGGTRGQGSRARGVRVRGSHPLRRAFPGPSAPAVLCNRAHGLRPMDARPATPHAATP